MPTIVPIVAADPVASPVACGRESGDGIDRRYIRRTARPRECRADRMSVSIRAGCRELLRGVCGNRGGGRRNGDRRERTGDDDVGVVARAERVRGGRMPDARSVELKRQAQRLRPRLSHADVDRRQSVRRTVRCGERSFYERNSTTVFVASTSAMPSGLPF